MADLAAVLEAEVARLARKEIRGETEALKRTVASQRSEIAALKRRAADVEKSVKVLMRAALPKKGVSEPIQAVADEGSYRFRASGMANNRKRLGLSAVDLGLLVGASGQSIYSWEAGKTKPRAKALAAIAALRGVGKRRSPSGSRH